MLIRGATPADWPAMWPFVRRIAAAGETFTWDREIGEEQARALWFPEPPGRSIVAVDPAGIVLGAAAFYPNQRGPALTLPARTSWWTPTMPGAASAARWASTFSS